MDEDNKTLNIIIGVFAIIIFILFMLNTMEIPSIKCIKSQNLCEMYTRKTFYSPKLTRTFKISDILSYKVDIDYHLEEHSATTYRLILVMKDGSRIKTDFYSHREDQIDTIYLNIISPNDYKLEGTFFKTLTDAY